MHTCSQAPRTHSHVFSQLFSLALLSLFLSLTHTQANRGYNNCGNLFCVYICVCVFEKVWWHCRSYRVPKRPERDLTRNSLATLRMPTIRAANALSRCVCLSRVCLALSLLSRARALSLCFRARAVTPCHSLPLTRCLSLAPFFSLPLSRSPAASSLSRLLSLSLLTPFFARVRSFSPID